MASGERFCSLFPLAVTEYVSVCFLEIWIDRCICEEEEEESLVYNRLNSIYNGAYVETIEVHVNSYDTDDPEEVLFQMDQSELYKIVAELGEARLPPKFEAEVKFTHATAVLKNLITTANNLYTEKNEDCIPASKLLCTS